MLAYRHSNSGALDWIVQAVLRAVVYRTVFGLPTGAFVLVAAVALVLFVVRRRRSRRA